MKQWWKEATVYEIYVRSFKDSTGDGLGDIGGIISKLGYLKKLGVDVIWLTPIYESPEADNGYDISNYLRISPKFGTMKMFDRLLKETHKRGMRLIMDGVFNHTSDEHSWFLESKKSRTNKYRDYYFWRNGQKDREPNNWVSFFGGSVWEYDKDTRQYYLHIFSKKQPDLNWDNKAVREEIYAIMKWWLDKGIDGFRFDVINFISKTRSLRDANPSRGKKYADGSKYYKNGPNINKYLKEMNMRVLSKYDIMTVGETAANIEDINATRLYVDSRRHELNMVFHENNEIHSDKKTAEIATLLDKRHDKFKWTLSNLKRTITAWQEGLGDYCWDTAYLGNHDYPRIVSRFGDDKKYRTESAKMLATLIFTLRGTPFIYQGDEIGMTNGDFKSINDYVDIGAINMYNEYLSRHKNGRAYALKILRKISRDNARTPMQWDDSRNAGFSKRKPWIKVNSNYRTVNVEAALKDKNSIFYYYKKLIEIRKGSNTMMYGKYRQVLDKHPDIFAYTRSLGSEKILVLLNFKGKATKFKQHRDVLLNGAELIIGNYPESENKYELRPYEAAVYVICSRHS